MPEKFRIGLLGSGLTHTKSPELFQSFFKREGILNVQYDIFDLPQAEQIGTLLQLPRLAGFNVTIPYKKTIIPYLDELDEIALHTGAVNTVVKVRSSNVWKGYNTDVIGFEKTIKLLALPRKPAVVIGTGGASQAVQYVLRRSHFPVFIMSRDSDRQTLAYGDLDREIVAGLGLIVNTTPLGKIPDIDEAPRFRYDYLQAGTVLVDLNYNPAVSVFLKHGLRRGCRVMNGRYMLKEQARESWKLWKEQILRS